MGCAVQLLTPLPQALADGNVVVNPGRSRGDKKKSERADPPGKAVKFAAEVLFLRLGAHRARSPFQVELVNISSPASRRRPRHLPFPAHPPSPGQVKVARGEDARRGRHELGDQQASAAPGPVTCGESGPSPASLPFSRPYPCGPACEDPAARPQPLQLVTTGGGERGSPAGGERQAPRS